MKSISEQEFASLNFGIYVIALFGVFSESISKWLTIELSKKKRHQYKKFLLSVYYEATPYFISIIILITGILIALFPHYLVLLLICSCIGTVLYVYMYLRAWINSIESYIFLGILLLGVPFARLVSSLFLVDISYLWMFWFILFAGISLIISSVLFLKSKHKNFFKLEKYKDPNIIKESKIFTNSLIQFAINIFWIADGIILKGVLPTDMYNTYVTYAYIYKFPFLISASFVLVILGKNILSKSKLEEYKKSLLYSISLIVAGFSLVIAVDNIWEGKILSILGYDRYVTEKLTTPFGIAWMVQTLNYLLFSSILKTTDDPQTVNGIALSYAVSYCLVLFISKGDIFHLTYGILIHGATYLLMTAIHQYHLLNKAKD
jgi:MFS family permease